MRTVNNYKKCSFGSCGKPHEARGYCNGHYKQLLAGRELKPLTGRSRTSYENFWSKVVKTDQCWVWTGAKTRGGYGLLSIRGLNRYAHVASYEMSNGAKPKEMDVNHRCHNPRCVNPSHLELVTRKQNMEDRIGAQRNSLSGIRGVRKARGCDRWEAEVKHNGTRHYVGMFKTPAEAENAAIKKRNELFTHNHFDRQDKESSDGR